MMRYLIVVFFNFFIYLNNVSCFAIKRWNRSSDFISNVTSFNGRLGNQIIRNVAVSFIAEKFDLYHEYSSIIFMEKLGIKLYSGQKKWNKTIELSDHNYFDILHQSALESNLNALGSYFQTKDITKLIVDHLHCDEIKTSIIIKNPFNERYNLNRDLFVHVRLADAASFNSGLKYYLFAISNITFESIYISTDQKNHSIIHQIIEIYPKSIIIDFDEIETLQFGSTCKNIILSHGSFSAIIGMLSFFSKVNYPEFDPKKQQWHGDIFSSSGWKEISYLHANYSL